jgi:hypothetical protein
MLWLLRRRRPRAGESDGSTLMTSHIPTLTISLEGRQLVQRARVMRCRYSREQSREGLAQFVSRPPPPVTCLCRVPGRDARAGAAGRCRSARGQRACFAPQPRASCAARRRAARRVRAAVRRAVAAARRARRRRVRGVLSAPPAAHRLACSRPAAAPAAAARTRRSHRRRRDRGHAARCVSVCYKRTQCLSLSCRGALLTRALPPLIRLRWAGAGCAGACCAGGIARRRQRRWRSCGGGGQ